LVLRGDLVSLRELRSDDLEAVHSWSSDPEVVRFLRWGPNTITQTRDYIDAELVSARAKPRLKYGLVLVPATGGAPVGAITARASENLEEFDLGYALHRGFWDLGYMTEAVKLTVNLCLQELRARRVSAVCDVANVASGRVLEKAGLRFDGVIPGYVRVRGSLRDVRSYSIESGI